MTIAIESERAPRLRALVASRVAGDQRARRLGDVDRLRRALRGAITACWSPPRGPPVERMVLLSRLDETVRGGERSIELGTARFPGAVHPRGFERLVRFERDLFPVFEYDLDGVVEGVVLRKTVAAIRGENTVVVLYELAVARGRRRRSSSSCARSTPSAATTSWARRRDRSGARRRSRDDVLLYRAWDGAPEVHLRVPGAGFEPAPDWWLRFELEEEIERGFDGHEDLFTPGVLRVEAAGARPGLGVVVSTAPAAGRDAAALLAAERRRRERAGRCALPTVAGAGGERWPAWCGRWPWPPISSWCAAASATPR